MGNLSDFSRNKQKTAVYVLLAVVTLAVFWRVSRHDFITFDDTVYVTQNRHVLDGFTPESLRWAFTTTHAEFWHPLVWLSFMADYRLYGLNAGGYHVTNLVLHLLSALLLFRLMNAMTGAVWRSAFVAAVFALHPLHVEPVAWVSGRKDVLSAFFAMCTFNLYIRYAQKPDKKRYGAVLGGFILALMSKPMVVTLPVMMILLDFWPLGRIQPGKGGPVIRQLKEKLAFLILSAVFAVLTVYAQYDTTIKTTYPPGLRLAKAPVFFVTYLGKIFRPHNLAVGYPFSDQISLWQTLGSFLLIAAVTAVSVAERKRLPYLLVGWLWYAVTLLPVIGIIPVGDPMADRYAYLPSIGIAVMLAWGIPSLARRLNIPPGFPVPTGAAVLAVLAVLSWRQCGYWENSLSLFDHSLRVTGDNPLAYNSRGSAYARLGRYQEAIDDFDRAIRLKPEYDNAYYNRGNVCAELGRFQQAIDDYSHVIRLKPDHVRAYYNRGTAYARRGQWEQAIDDYTNAVLRQPDYALAYHSRSIAYLSLGDREAGYRDAEKACSMGICSAMDGIRSSD